MDQQKSPSKSAAMVRRRPGLSKALLTAMRDDLAPAAFESHTFGLGSPKQALVVMLMGHELGFAPMASFQYIYIIQGKPSLSPRGHLALALERGVIQDWKISEKPGQSCTVWMKRRPMFSGDPSLEYEITTTIDQARQAGLVKQDSGWSKYPQNMLRWRAIGWCLDVIAPEVAGGLKRSDEFGAPITAGGDVIEGEWSEVPTQAATSNAPILDESLQASTLIGMLVDEYGAAAVMGANGGKIPQTLQEVKAVQGYLLAEAQLAKQAACSHPNTREIDGPSGETFTIVCDDCGAKIGGGEHPQ